MTRGVGGEFFPPDGGIVEEIPGVIDLASPATERKSSAPDAAFNLDEGPPPTDDAVVVAAAADALAAPAAGAKTKKRDQRGAAPASRRLVLLGLGVLVLAAVGVGLGVFGQQLLGGRGGGAGGADTDATAIRSLLAEDTYPALTKAGARFAADPAAPPHLRGLAAQAQLLAIVAHLGPRDLLGKVRTTLGPPPAKGPPPREYGLALALLLVADGKTAEATATLGALAAAQPQDPAVPLYLGWAHLGANRAKEAAVAFQRSVELKASAAAAFGAGTAREASGDVEGARVFFDRALATTPTHAASALAIARLTRDPSAREAALRKVLTEKAVLLSPGERASGLAAVGDVLRDSGRLEEAERSFEQALAAEHASTRAQNGLASVLFESGRYEAALQRYQDLRRLVPKDLEAAVGAARCLLELGRLLDADEPIAAAERLGPDDARVLVLRGLRQERTETPAAIETALKSYLAALKADAKHAPAYAALAGAYLKLKKDGEAFAALKQAQATLPANAVIDNAFGEAYLRGGELTQAEERLRAAVAKNPLYHLARFNLGAVLEKQNRPDAAEKEYRTVAEKAPRFAGLAERRARIYQRLGRVDQALAAFDDALRAERPPAALRLAAAALFIDHGARQPCLGPPPAEGVPPAPGASAPSPPPAPGAPAAPRSTPPPVAAPPPAPPGVPPTGGPLGRDVADPAASCFALARRAADSVLLEDPRNAIANDLVGRALAGLGRPDEGLQYVRRAASIDTSRPEFHLHVGEILEQLGRYDLAMQELALAVGGGPTLVGPYVARGRIFVRQRQFREALVELGKAGQRDRTRADIPRLQGDAFAGLRQLAPAVDAYQTAVRRAPHDAEAHYKLGEACADAERRGPAVEAFRKALHLGGDKAPWAPDVHRRLGFIHKESGARGPAVAEFRRYLELKPDAADKGEILQQLRFLE
jgi:tetratricopeptide (TPR) repeat protein